MQLIYVHSAKIKTTGKCGIFNIYLFFICFVCVYMCACMCRCVYIGQLAEVSFFLPPCVFQETSGHQAHSKSSHPQSCILLPNSKALRIPLLFLDALFFFYSESNQSTLLTSGKQLWMFFRLFYIFR